MIMIIQTYCKILYCNVTDTWEKKTITFAGDTTGTLIMIMEQV
jgi:hypothetical protein